MGLDCQYRLLLDAISGKSSITCRSHLILQCLRPKALLEHPTCLQSSQRRRANVQELFGNVFKVSWSNIVKNIRYYRSDVRARSLKGTVLVVSKGARGTPLGNLRWVTLMASNFARFRSYPKSFRIWSFQTDVTSGFQGFCLKLSHLGEIFDQSWKIGGEFDILTTIRK